MNRSKRATGFIFMMLAGLLIAASVTGYSQDATMAKSAASQQAATDTAPGITHVGSGQTMTVEGLIVRREADSFTMEGGQGKFYTVVLNSSTTVRERKSNPLRSAKSYPATNLLRGLTVEVTGRGDASGSIQAEKIRLRNDDLRVAESLQAGINPVERQLKEAEGRLAQAEQNQQRLSGQVEELQAVSNAARGGAKAAQETADAAVKSADEAKAGVNEAKTGVRMTNDRITSLDDYDVKEDVTINFKAGSSVLSKEAKENLDRVAEQAKAEKGFLIEVAGFASSDGNEAFNQVLSQRRADKVIQYLAENYNIPMRRFVSPLGYGDKQPVASNKTHDGRVQNRRVEVRILINKGLAQSTSTMASKGLATN